MKLLERTSALVVAALLAGAAGCTNNDAAITTRVKHAISKQAGLKETKVSVSTDQKVVHLSGTVKSRDERAMLIAVARKVEGVREVKTDLVVKAPEKPAVESKPKSKRTAQARAKPRTKLVTQPAAKFEGTGR